MYIEISMKSIFTTTKDTFVKDVIKEKDKVEEITIRFLGHKHHYFVKSITQGNVEVDKDTFDKLNGKDSIYNADKKKTNESAIDYAIKNSIDKLLSGVAAPVAALPAPVAALPAPVAALPAPNFTLSTTNETITVGKKIVGYTINSTGGPISSFSINPVVSDGLSFDTATGLISGIPTSVAPAKTYKITGKNLTDSVTVDYTLTVEATKGGSSISGGYNSMKKSRSFGTKRKRMKLGYTRYARRSKRSL
jgi:hypothetical protein